MSIFANKARKYAAKHKEETGMEWWRMPHLLLGTVAAVIIVAFLFMQAVNSLIKLPSMANPVAIEESFTFAQQKPAEIVRIEPIAIECRAAIEAEVPVLLQKDVHYKTFGWNVFTRTERGAFTSFGDVDTCLAIDHTRIFQTANGGWTVNVNVDDIVFRRPRVDMLRSFDTWIISVDWDWAPWVDGDTQMGLEAAALAQYLIGSSSCIEAAFDVTVDAIEASYKDQAASIGIDPALVNVVIDGTPSYDAYVDDIMNEYDQETLDRVDELLEEYGFDDDPDNPVECRLSDELNKKETELPVPDVEISSTVEHMA
jgi:hypothetical protein